MIFVTTSCSILYLKLCSADINELRVLRFRLLLIIVSFLFKVRDAAARLPKGEGTRAEICNLLHDSSFICADVNEAQVHCRNVFICLYVAVILK